ncbi:protein BCCIP homolog isoform X5 [Neltuma alba]|uniref:protein BCCIP homolog isoform X5 n=1 Tax=Neltuma alba TaxID=207710 RepID=UPI0010A30CB6|nr:protein BCCIP homolog isoform X5 [Prosopis alba]
MPRRPRRRSQHLKSRPLTFSRFARSVAQMASTSKSNKKSYRSFAVSKSLSHCPGYGLAKHTLEEKTEQSESSDEEFETTVGTVVKVEDDEDEGLFAVVTALNLWRYREQKCIEELKDFLLKVCKEKGTFDQLKLLLGEQAHDVGLLVSQRVVNLPLQLLPHLYDALFDEVSWATEDEPTEELRNSFKLTHYIIYSKIYKVKPQHKNAEQNRKLNKDDDNAVIYIKPEDELFHKLSSWFFYFPLQTSQPETRELKNYMSVGLVMAVEAGKIPTFRQELRSLMSEP